MSHSTQNWSFQRCSSQSITHTTHTTILLLFWNLSGTTRVSRYQKGITRKVKTNLDLLEQEIVSGSGICWAICKSAPHPRQPRQHPTTQFFYRPDALPAAQPTASKHWRQFPANKPHTKSKQLDGLQWIWGLTAIQAWRGCTAHLLLCAVCTVDIDGTDHRNWGPSGTHIAQTLCPPPKLTYKMHILGMSSSPRNDSHCPKLCHLSCAHHKHPIRITSFSCFGGLENPCRNSENFHWCTRVHTDSHIHVFCLQNGWNQCRISGQKAALVSWQKKKHILAPCGDFPPFLCECTYHGPSLIFQIPSRSVQVWGSYNRNPPSMPTSKVNAI